MIDNIEINDLTMLMNCFTRNHCGNEHIQKYHF